MTDITNAFLEHIYVRAHRKLVRLFTITFNMWSREREKGKRKIWADTNQTSHFSNLNAKNCARVCPHWKIKYSVEGWTKEKQDTKKDCRFESFSLVAARGNSFFHSVQLMVVQGSNFFPTAEFFPFPYFCFGFYLKVFDSPVLGEQKKKMFQKGFTACTNGIGFMLLRIVSE